jgi:aspartokinase
MITRERFLITEVREEDRIGLTVTVTERAPLFTLLLTKEFERRKVSVDMFVLHRKGQKVTASILFENGCNLTSSDLRQIAQCVEETADGSVEIQLHTDVTKMSILGHGLCTARRSSIEIFEKIRSAGLNIEMMSISENEVNLVFHPSPEVRKIVDGISRRIGK